MVLSFQLEYECFKWYTKYVFIVISQEVIIMLLMPSILRECVHDAPLYVFISYQSNKIAARCGFFLYRFMLIFILFIVRHMQYIFIWSINKTIFFSHIQIAFSFIILDLIIDENYGCFRDVGDGSYYGHNFGREFLKARAETK